MVLHTGWMTNASQPRQFLLDLHTGLTVGELANDHVGQGQTHDLLDLLGQLGVSIAGEELDGESSLLALHCETGKKPLGVPTPRKKEERRRKKEVLSRPRAERGVRADWINFAMKT